MVSTPMEKVLAFFICVLICLMSSVLFAVQSVTLGGRVVESSSGEPLANANIIIQGTQLGAASDADGRFIIKNIPAASYQVKATFIGFESSIVDIDLTKDESHFVEFKLRDSFFLTEQVVVTATRTKKLMENVPVVTEVISEAEIIDTGAENLAQVLEDRPGISIEQGIAGGKTLRMCGIDGKYVLILIDGTPISGKFNNRQELHLIDSNQIDHIEIVKGPGSVLYGSEAMGGVINVITKGYDENLSMKAEAKAGSFGLYRGNAALSGTMDKFAYAVNIDHTRGGIDKGEISINVTGTQTFHVGGKVSLKPEHLGSFECGYNYNFDQQRGEDPVFFTSTDVARNDGHLDWKKALSSKIDLSGKLYLTDNQRTYSETVRRSGHLARTNKTHESVIGLRTDATYRFCDFSQLNSGYDFSINDYRSERILNSYYQRVLHGFFAQSETFLFDKKLTFIIGGRYDDISGVGAHMGPRVNGMYAFTPKLKARASWGSGFRAPSFTDMYIDYDNVFIGYRVEGNADLKPERSDGSSFGVEYFWNYLVLMNATVYRNHFRDMILDYVKGPGTLSYKNVESAVFTNFEFQNKLLLMQNLSCVISYSYTEATKASDIDAMLNISPHQAALKLNWNFAQFFRLSLRDNWYSERHVHVFDRRLGIYLDGQFTVKQAYHMMDVTLNWNAGKQLFGGKEAAVSPFANLFTLRFGVNNIANYTDALYGPWIGRRLYVSLEVAY